ncbi:nucleotidyltransferase domain-containing protein [candidate division WOR-3 bacterium]|uniref:Nucleotidyltransferase domain-containing protein n=1 Tax=candidate division WOR-3 bacterium TaxID=2052148 RepID=A0A9D5KA10_UNCW3|nr:nucleotidyltransferase domain-containing protein [candidate division WOR-3 bacterium]MBD3364330.1 nucleotidyltransferase domain-containing protein [candidate division WOR-3 bacterium]
MVEEKKILTELRKALSELYGERLDRLVLFGSRARNDAEPESDIDVMVVLTGQVNPGEEIARTAEVVSSLSLKYDVVVSCVFTSTENYETSQNPLLMNVRREGLPV